MTIEQICKRLQDRNLMAVARGAGVAYETVRKLAKGRGDNLRHTSVLKIAKYLEQVDG